MAGLSTLPKFYSCKEIAEMLQMRADSVVRKIKKGQLKGVKRGNKWLIERSEVEQMLQHMRQGQYR